MQNVVIHTEAQRRVCGLCTGLFHSAENSREMENLVYKSMKLKILPEPKALS